MNAKIKAKLIFVEFLSFYILIPIVLFTSGSKLGVFAALWGIGLYALQVLMRMPGFSFHKLWHGEGWTMTARRHALVRFLILAGLLTLLTVMLLPEKFMRFPLDHFSLWLAVMALYPLLSVVPQELLFRSYFFKRYTNITGENMGAILINGVLFGFSHITFNNWIAPICGTLAGIILANSYRQHHSLKWAVIEHSFYGCWVFTIGFGWYFFISIAPDYP